MASTFTTSKNFEKQGSGDHTGVWDGPLNGNFDIVEKGLVGIVQKTLGSTAVGLTQTELQNSVISLSGTLTANITVFIPDGIAGHWIVGNFTTGAFSVAIKNVSSANPVTMQQGRAQIIYSDGANCALANNLLVDDTTKMPKSGGTFTGPIAATTIAGTINVQSLGELYGSWNGTSYRNYRTGDNTWGIIDRSNTGSMIWQDMSANTKATLDAAGNFTAVGNVAAYSDARIKTNVRTIDGALNLIESMRGVRYERLANGRTEVGVIAQEMQAVLPEVVEAPGGEALMAVSYGNIVGVLIEAVKELSARVRELEAK